MRDYELTVLFGGRLGEKEMDKEIKSLQDLLEKNGAKISKKTDPTKKMLAYEVKKQREGFYVYFEVNLEPEKVAEVENKIRLMDNVIRHLIIAKSYKV